MTSTASESVDRLEERYRVRFAGHPRVSRDPEELERIVGDLEQIGTDAGPELKARVDRLRELYSREVAEIQAAINVPFAVPAARLRMWTELTLGRYRRRFAGQDRRTRDVALLEELIADLQRLRREMARVHGSAPAQKLDEVLASVDRSLETYGREAEAIRAARRTGSLPEQGTRLAQLANAQFEAYAWGFAGQSRLSRHPPTLERIASALEEILRGMLNLRIAGFSETNNDRNIGIVEGRIRQYREEIGEIRKAHRGGSLSQRIGALGQAANQVFAMYREEFSGKPRQQTDPDRLDQLFERLWPVAREMDALDSDHDDDGNARNLRLVTDYLLMFAREHEAIRQAKG